MSLKAMVWVMEHADVQNQGELAVLYALADRAHDDGTAAWPSQEWIADRARCTARTVRNHLSRMEERGVISKGDQRLVEHLQGNRRPVVWDLNMSPENTPESREENFSGRKVTTLRAESYDSQGGKLRQLGRNVASDKPSLTIHEPSKNLTPLNPPKGKRGSRLPDGWQPNASNRAKIVERHPWIDVDEELEKFTDYWTAESGARATKRDWDAAFRLWMRNAQTYADRSKNRVSRESDHTPGTRAEDWLGSDIPVFADCEIIEDAKQLE